MNTIARNCERHLAIEPLGGIPEDVGFSKYNWCSWSNLGPQADVLTSQPELAGPGAGLLGNLRTRRLEELNLGRLDVARIEVPKGCAR